ncbi:MAG: phage portal protein [Holosporales bacterium]|jgi:HK97 family phage portal protein|nr:phage portal protein [Holosporales bacterium]
MFTLNKNIKSVFDGLKSRFLASTVFTRNAGQTATKSSSSTLLKIEKSARQFAGGSRVGKVKFQESPSKTRSFACKTGTHPVWSLRDYNSLATTGYKQNVIVFRCINLIAKSLSSISFCAYELRSDENEYKLDDHPILRLLNAPAQRVSGAFFLESVFSQLMLSGNAYVKVVRGPQKESADDASPRANPPAQSLAGGTPPHLRALPVRLSCLRSDKVCLLVDEAGAHVGFQYKNCSKTQFFPIDKQTGLCDILHVKTFHPLSDWYGMSPIEAAARAIDQHNAVGEHNLSILQNGGRPSGALLIKPQKNGLTMTQEQRESLREDLYDMYQGVENAGRLAVIEGDCEWKEMGLSPKDLDFNKGKNSSAREIAQAFGVPPILLGMTEDATFSNYKEARINFWEDTLLPLLNHFISELNMWLVPLFHENLRLAYNKDDIPALTARRDCVWAKMQESSFLTINEKRRALGYCPLPDGDALGGACEGRP